jgi:cystathionine gamma-lyase
MTLSVYEEEAQRFGTRAIHAGQPAEPTTGAVIVPISLSTTYQQASPGVHKGFEYSRSGNPTRNALEACIASIECGKHGLAFSSGLGATTTITALLAPGDEIISGDDVYGGTRRIFSKVLLPHTGIKSHFVDFNNKEEFAAVLNEKTKMIWIETPTNPLLKLFDIKAIAETIKGRGIIFVVDNTFMTPYFQQPLKHGVDIVMHSATKYLNGHSDVVMGVAITNNDEIHERLRYLQNAMGAVPSPFDSFLLLRGLKTLHLRMKAHEENAKRVVDYLLKHNNVEHVIYPGLESHPQHAIARQQMTGYGGMISFILRGNQLTEAKKFLEALQLIALAESLGGVESLIESPAIMTHASVPPEARLQLGISDSLIRLSVGVEDVEDIIDDLERGFKSAFPPGL